MGRSHPRAFNRVAGKTWRFSRNRCPRKRIGQFPAYDAHLLSDLGILCLVLIGFVLLAILHVLNVVFVIIASIRASEGKFYRYPLTIRFLN